MQRRPTTDRLLSRIRLALKLRRAARWFILTSSAGLGVLLLLGVVVWFNQSGPDWQWLVEQSQAQGLATVPLFLLGLLALCALAALFTPLSAKSALQWADLSTGATGRAATQVPEDSAFRPVLEAQQKQDLAEAVGLAFRNFRPGYRALLVPVLAALCMAIPSLMLLTRAPQKELTLLNVVRTLEPLAGSLFDAAGASVARELATRAGVPELAQATTALEELGSALEQGGMSASEALTQLNELREKAASSTGSDAARGVIEEMARNPAMLETAQRLLGGATAPNPSALSTLGRSLGLGEGAEVSESVGDALKRLVQGSPLARNLLKGITKPEDVPRVLNLEDNITKAAGDLEKRINGSTPPVSTGPRRLLIELPVTPRDPDQVSQAAPMPPVLVESPKGKPELSVPQDSDFRSFLNRIPRRYRERTPPSE